jgi:uncharacterized membrane protein YhaH (DUF805 family)
MDELMNDDRKKTLAVLLIILYILAVLTSIGALILLYFIDRRLPAAILMIEFSTWLLKLIKKLTEAGL